MKLEYLHSNPTVIILIIIFTSIMYKAYFEFVFLAKQTEL